MKKHHILCLQETKTDNLDIIEINGFEIKMKTEPSMADWILNSGGIKLAYKKELSEFTTAIWFESLNKAHKLWKKLLVGEVYIPPENCICIFIKYASTWT